MAEALYNINIADYIEIEDGSNNNNFLRFFADLNHDNNHSKNLCLRTSISNNYFKLLFGIIKLTQIRVLIKFIKKWG